MLEFIIAMLLYQVYDPSFWIALAVGAVLGKSRWGLAVGAAIVAAVAAFGWWTVLNYQGQMGNGPPPVSVAVLYFGGKFFAFALGVAFNRLILRIEKRAARVLEKAGT